MSADTDLAADISVSAYRQPFLIADTDTADTEKCANMPIFPIPILVSAHPYYLVLHSLTVPQCFGFAVCMMSAMVRHYIFLQDEPINEEIEESNPDESEVNAAESVKQVKKGKSKKLKQCAYCLKEEPEPKTYKKCQK